VEADRWQVAIQRGPLVYCLEGCDQPAPLHLLGIRTENSLEASWEPSLLNGVMVIAGDALALHDESDWGDALYRPFKPRKPTRFRAIPYYAWDNRAPCPMRVWMPAI
jgi:DUF1680 family protein